MTSSYERLSRRPHPLPGDRPDFKGWMELGCEIKNRHVWWKPLDRESHRLARWIFRLVATHALCPLCYPVPSGRLPAAGRDGSESKKAAVDASGEPKDPPGEPVGFKSS